MNLNLERLSYKKQKNKTKQKRKKLKSYSLDNLYISTTWEIQVTLETNSSFVDIKRNRKSD